MYVADINPPRMIEGETGRVAGEHSSFIDYVNAGLALAPATEVS